MPVVVLGVDHPDSGCHHHEVVEIQAAPGDAAVVEHDSVAADEMVEKMADVFLTLCSTGPGLGRRLGPGEDTDQGR
jgi:hypothetical protein